MEQRTLIIKNRLGLHARAAARLVKVASGFESDIQLVRADAHDRRVDAKSIFGVLLLAATQGTKIEIIVDGGDENEAIEALCRLVEDKFGED